MKQSYLDQREDLNDEICAFINTQTTKRTLMPNITLFDDLEEAAIERWPLMGRKNVMVTPAAARSVYDTCQFRKQREISNRHVEKYAAAMASGTFKECSVVTIAVANKSRWIVDGNHTLLAVEKFGSAFPLTIEYRQVADEDEAAVLYSTFETRKRTLGAHMIAAGLDEITGVSPSMLARFTIGLSALEDGFPAKTHRLIDSAEKQELIGRWKEWCRPCNDLLAGKKYNKAVFSRSAAIALLFLTVRYQPAKAATFWNGILRNDGLFEGMPQHTAYGALNGSIGRDISVAEQFACLALAWNAYVDDKRLGFMRVYCGPIRVTVKGTPWVNRLTGSVKTEKRRQ